MKIPQLTPIIALANFLRLRRSERKTLGYNVLDVIANSLSGVVRSNIIPQSAQNWGAGVLAAVKGVMILTSGTIGDHLFDSKENTDTPTEFAEKASLGIVDVKDTQPFWAMTLTCIACGSAAISMILKHFKKPGHDALSWLGALTGAVISLNETSARGLYWVPNNEERETAAARLRPEPGFSGVPAPAPA